MPTKLADRVKETTSTAGAGAYALAGAVTGYRSFAAAFLTADEVGYCVEDGIDWEVGVGTLTSGTPWTLARTQVLSSSNAGAAVNWPAGVKNCFCTAPSSVLGAGSNTFAGSISVGGATPSASGAGLTFPAAQSASSNANTLDDYEEGTWTPAFAYSTPGNSSFTYSGQIGKYIKIGKQIKVDAYLAFSSYSKGTATGNPMITGLPFAVESGGFSVGSIVLSKAPFSGVSSCVVGSGSTINLYKQASNTALAVMDDLDADSEIRLSITYQE